MKDRKAYFREYSKAHRAQRREYQRRWRAANREHWNAYQRNWSAKQQGEKPQPIALRGKTLRDRFIEYRKALSA